MIPYCSRKYWRGTIILGIGGYPVTQPISSFANSAPLHVAEAQGGGACAVGQTRRATFDGTRREVHCYHVDVVVSITYLLQVNKNILWDHIGIVQKAQETSSDTGMNNTVCLVITVLHE